MTATNAIYRVLSWLFVNYTRYVFVLY